jgi:hypothetical protein
MHEHRESHRELVPKGSLVDCRDEPVAVLRRKLIPRNEIVSEASSPQTFRPRRQTDTPEATATAQNRTTHPRTT